MNTLTHIFSCFKTISKEFKGIMVPAFQVRGKRYLTASTECAKIFFMVYFLKLEAAKVYKVISFVFPIILEPKAVVLMKRFI